jgi:hypothetical protein
MTTVDAFMATLVSSRKTEIEALRAIILGAHPDITEGIKWNAPSFFYKDWFATFHLRTKVGVQIILHRGAKVKAAPMADIADPAGLLEWLAADRATIKFAEIGDIEARRNDLSSVIRSWIAGL